MSIGSSLPKDTLSRKAEVEHLLSLLAYEHLPPHLAVVSKPLHDLGHQMARNLEHEIELAAGLRKLIEAKDCLVRQAVAKGLRTPIHVVCLESGGHYWAEPVDGERNTCSVCEARGGYYTKKGRKP